jgi:hypothetical protein
MTGTTPMPVETIRRLMRHPGPPEPDDLGRRVRKSFTLALLRGQAEERGIIR